MTHISFFDTSLCLLQRRGRWRRGRATTSRQGASVISRGRTRLWTPTGTMWASMMTGSRSCSTPRGAKWCGKTAINCAAKILSHVHFLQCVLEAFSASRLNGYSWHSYHRMTDQTNLTTNFLSRVNLLCLCLKHFRALCTPNAPINCAAKILSRVHFPQCGSWRLFLSIV